jgi:hypothetical protein
MHEMQEVQGSGHAAAVQEEGVVLGGAGQGRPAGYARRGHGVGQKDAVLVQGETAAPWWRTVAAALVVGRSGRRREEEHDQGVRLREARANVVGSRDAM